MTRDAYTRDLGPGGRICPWCGKEDCPDRFDHDRSDAASETTWRRRAVAAAILAPDSLPDGES